MKKQLVENFKIQQEAITIVNDGISGETGENIILRDKRKLVEKLNLPKNKKIIVYAYSYH